MSRIFRDICPLSTSKPSSIAAAAEATMGFWLFAWIVVAPVIFGLVDMAREARGRGAGPR